MSAVVPPPQTTTATTTTTTDTRPSFDEFVEGIRKDALARGIRPEIVDEALRDVEEPLAVVLERDRTQAETVLSLEQYIQRRMTVKRIGAGREMMARHRRLLGDVTERYGVPARI